MEASSDDVQKSIFTVEQFQKWQEMKENFLQEMNEKATTDTNSIIGSSTEESHQTNSSNNQNSISVSTKRSMEDDDLDSADSSVEWQHRRDKHHDGDELRKKFPNFPPENEGTRRTPRDYSTATATSTLSRMSTVTPPSYPSPSSVSSPLGSPMTFKLSFIFSLLKS